LHDRFTWSTKEHTMGRRTRKSGWRTAASWAAAALAAAAVAKELSLPSESRTWHGRLLAVPYDFRVPTLDRVRERMWAPDNYHLLTPQVFGLGWTVNLGRALALVSGASTRA
jgi:hypothetical protein